MARSLALLKKTAFERLSAARSNTGGLSPHTLKVSLEYLLGKEGMRHEVIRACICCRPGTGVCDHNFRRNANRCFEAGNRLSRFLIRATACWHKLKTRPLLEASALVLSNAGPSVPTGLFNCHRYRYFWLDLAFGHRHQGAFCGLKDGRSPRTVQLAIRLIGFCGLGFMAYRRSQSKRYA